jgi:hypothetical protein
VIGDYNTTQYMDSKFKPQGKFVKIWREGYEGQELLPGVFDFERNFIFAARMKQVFPRRVMFTNEVLYNETIKCLKGKYTQKEMALYQEGMGYDSGTKYNHHTHYHFTARGVDHINWDFDVRDFLQRKL